MIIRDTWPQLFWLKDIKKDLKVSKVNKNGSVNISTTTTDEGVV